MAADLSIAWGYIAKMTICEQQAIREKAA